MDNILAIVIIISMCILAWGFGVTVGHKIGRNDANKRIDAILEDMRKEEDDLK